MGVDSCGDVHRNVVYHWLQRRGFFQKNYFRGIRQLFTEYTELWGNPFHRRVHESPTAIWKHTDSGILAIVRHDGVYGDSGYFDGIVTAGSESEELTGSVPIPAG